MIDQREILPGWSMIIDKVSENLYQFVATDKHGYKFEILDPDVEKGSRRCLEGAFDIEQKIGKHTYKFFFDIISGLANNPKVIEKRYDDEVFGSWVIQTKDMRIVLDGRDYEIRIEKKNSKLFKKNWITLRQITHLENLKYSDLEQITEMILNNA